MPAEQGPPAYEVLAALVVSLRQELADVVALSSARLVRKRGLGESPALVAVTVYTRRPRPANPVQLRRALARVGSAWLTSMRGRNSRDCRRGD